MRATCKPTLESSSFSTQSRRPFSIVTCLTPKTLPLSLAPSLSRLPFGFIKNLVQEVASFFSFFNTIKKHLERKLESH